MSQNLSQKEKLEAHEAEVRKAVRKLLLGLATPNPLATGLGLAVATFHTPHAASGAWAVAAVALTGLATGYGTTWGLASGMTIGGMGGAVVGSLVTRREKPALSKAFPVDSETRDYVARLISVTKFSGVGKWVCGGVGFVAGSVAAFHLSHTPLNNWAIRHSQTPVPAAAEMPVRTAPAAIIPAAQAAKL